MEHHSRSSRRRPFESTAQGQLLNQVLSEIAEMRQQMATRDDLRTLVARETYEANRVADQQRATENGLRITHVEEKFDRLETAFHNYQLQDVRQFGQAQLGTQQQLGQIQAGATQSVAHGQVKSISMLNALLVGALSLLGGGFLTLLITFVSYAASHR